MATIFCTCKCKLLILNHGNREGLINHTGLNSSLEVLFLTSTAFKATAFFNNKKQTQLHICLPSSGSIGQDKAKAVGLRFRTELWIRIGPRAVLFLCVLLCLTNHLTEKGGEDRAESHCVTLDITVIGSELRLRKVNFLVCDHKPCCTTKTHTKQEESCVEKLLESITCLKISLMLIYTALKSGNRELLQ